MNAQWSALVKRGWYVMHAIRRSTRTSEQMAHISERNIDAWHRHDRAERTLAAVRRAPRTTDHASPDTAHSRSHTPACERKTHQAPPCSVPRAPTKQQLSPSRCRFRSSALLFATSFRRQLSARGARVIAPGRSHLQPTSGLVSDTCSPLGYLDAGLSLLSFVSLRSLATQPASSVSKGRD